MSNKIETFTSYTLLSVGFPVMSSISLEKQEEVYQKDIQEFKDNLEAQGLADVVRFIPYRAYDYAYTQISRVDNIHLPLSTKTYL